MTEVVKCSNNMPRAYDISEEGDSITFRPCGFKSTYKVDVETRYCRLCQLFVDDEVYDPLTDPELKEE